MAVPCAEVLTLLEGGDHVGRGVEGLQLPLHHEIHLTVGRADPIHIHIAYI